MNIVAALAVQDVMRSANVAGTLMLFQGRRSLHRVSSVEGDVPRIVALLAYDTRPESDTSDLFKLIRYGRSEPRPPAA